jgi:hypothetical protein
MEFIQNCRVIGGKQITAKSYKQKLMDNDFSSTDLFE